MKKFSKTSVDNTKPKENKVSTNKCDILSLIDNILSIRSYGPTDRYSNQGSFTIAGKEMLANAIVDYINKKDKKETIHVLENLKNDIRQWDILDEKIDNLKNDINLDYDKKRAFERLINRYDGDLLINYLDNKEIKIDSSILEHFKKDIDIEIYNQLKNKTT